MVQLIDAITAMHSEIWNTTVALVGLVASMEQELALTDLYEAQRLQGNKLLANQQSMSWSRANGYQLVEAMKECRNLRRTPLDKIENHHVEVCSGRVDGPLDRSRSSSTCGRVQRITRWPLS